MNANKDLIIEALLEWVVAHPEEAKKPFKVAEVAGERKQISLKFLLYEMVKRTDFGNQEYKKLVQLTIDLISRGKITLTNEIYQRPWPAGNTETSKDEFLRLRDQLGRIECVMVLNLTSATEDTEVVIVGNLARLHLDGFGLGYLGEGPKGFMWLLEQLDIPFKESDILGKQMESTKVFIVPGGGE